MSSSRGDGGGGGGDGDNQQYRQQQHQQGELPSPASALRRNETDAPNNLTTGGGGGGGNNYTDASYRGQRTPSTPGSRTSGSERNTPIGSGRSSIAGMPRADLQPGNNRFVAARSSASSFDGNSVSPATPRGGLGSTRNAGGGGGLGQHNNNNMMTPGGGGDGSVSSNTFYNTSAAIIKNGGGGHTRNGGVGANNSNNAAALGAATSASPGGVPFTSNHSTEGGHNNTTNHHRTPNNNNNDYYYNNNDVGTPNVGGGGGGGGGGRGGNAGGRYAGTPGGTGTTGGDGMYPLTTTGGGGAGGGGGNGGNNNNNNHNNGGLGLGGGSTRLPLVPQSSLGSVQREALLFGTTVGIGPTMALCKSFLHGFRMSMSARVDRQEQRYECERRGYEVPASLAEELDPVTDEDNEIPHYKSLLEELADEPQTGQYVLVGIDAKHIFSFTQDGRKLYSQLVRYPQEIIPIFDLVLNEEFAEMSTRPGADETAIPPAVRCRIYNLRDPKRMRMLDPIDIDTLVSVRGMVIRTSEIIPDMRRGHFRCTTCGYTRDVDVENGRLEEPAVCDGCTTRHSMALVHNRCIFFDKQMIKLQETPESIPEGETPMTIVLYAFEDLVDSVVPGDRIQVTGVFRAVGTRPNPAQRSLRSVFRTYIDVIHFQKAEKDRMTSMDPHKTGAEYSHDVNIATEVSAVERRAERCRLMAQEPDLYSRLAHSLAPSIWELDDVKKGVLLQLFGGCNKDLGREGKIRGEINVLLCGDPGTSKSQLLTYVHKIAPRGMYTSGTGSSAVGLTAFITKDPESKEPVLESGALVLSDRGVCCIDEFDKMTDATRSILHEVMEQQTVSIAKAGIICTLNARTSVLASANPVESRYNPNLSVVENIQLPPTLLSRFDLIYLILDTVNADSDRRLARHLVALHWPESAKEAEAMKSGNIQFFERTALMEYISFVKEMISPVLSDEANDALVKGYLDMRRLGASGRAGGRKTITATTRQLESLIRLSEAHARMRFSDIVEVSDVMEAIRLMNVATQRAAVDPRTGTINMELITTGHSSLERDAQSILVEEIREALEDRAALGPGRSMSVAELQKLLDRNSPELSLSREALVEALKELSNEDNAFLQLDGRGDRFKFLASGRRSSSSNGAGTGVGIYED